MPPYAPLCPPPGGACDLDPLSMQYVERTKQYIPEMITALVSIVLHLTENVHNIDWTDEFTPIDLAESTALKALCFLPALTHACVWYIHIRMLSFFHGVSEAELAGWVKKFN